jgi:predicted metal-dependent phosphoesterase TrpH
MQTFPGRYNTDGPWFRGNTHLHTTFSDGGKDYAETARLYAEAGYDFTFVTDHNHAGQVDADTDLPLAVFNGIEVGGPDSTGANYHVVGLGYDGDAPEGKNMDWWRERFREAGALAIIAHPAWMNNSVADALRHDFDGVEVYNHICNFLNGKGQSVFHADQMLEVNPATLCISADDAHMHGDQPYAGGWIMVAAASCTQADILDAIRAGNFYATQGPRFESIHVDSRTIRVHTSPVSAVRITSAGPWAQRVWRGGDPTIIEAEFDVENEDRPYIRVEIEDANGRMAWTNAVLRPTD